MRAAAAAFILFSLLLPSAAQQRTVAPTVAQVGPLPDDAVRQNARLAANLSPSAKSKVQAAASALAAAAKQQPAMTAAQMQSKARTSVSQAFPSLGGMDIDAVVFMVMMQCAQDQQSELQQAMTQMQQNTQAKQAARNAQNSADQLSDASEMQSMQLQMLMDRRSKMLEALSNVMKTASGTQSAVIANLK
jgi:hypothetical protein